MNETTPIPETTLALEGAMRLLPRLDRAGLVAVRDECNRLIRERNAADLAAKDARIAELQAAIDAAERTA
jgi:hypothetical protein